MKRIFSLAISLALISTSIATAAAPLAGMPPLLDQNDIYAADRLIN